MIKNILCLTLCLLFINATPGFANPPEQSKLEKLKKQIVDWGVNKTIRVELNTKEKIEGRIASIQDEIFTLQFLQGGKIASRDFRFEEVKKLSARDGGKAGKIAGYTALGVLAGLGTLAIITLAVWANN